MKQLDANTLVAYVDGELDMESAKFVEQLLAEDDDAARTADILRETALLVRAAHNHVIHETVPERLVDTLLMTVETDHDTREGVPEHLVNMILDAPEDELDNSVVTDATASQTTAPVISLARRRSVAAVAMAATVAAFMLGGGFLLGQQQNPGQLAGNANQARAVVAASDPFREAAFQEALETRKSDAAVVWTNPDNGLSGAVIPVKTYRRADGTFCRAFRTVETGSAPDQPNYGVACREPGKDGRWVKTVEAVAGPGVTPKLSF